jgi:hypothetical protein
MIGYLMGIAAHDLVIVAAGATGVTIWTVSARGRALGLQCQVPRSSSLSTNPHYLWWGAILGCGVATKIPHSLFLIVLLGLAPAGFPAGIAIGALYGATRASVAVALAYSQAGAQPSATMQGLARIRAGVKGMNLAAVVIATLVLPFSLLVSTR